MAVQATHLYDSGYEVLFADGSDPLAGTAGTYMWSLASSTYTAADTHTTTTNVTGQVTGDGAPIAATNLAITATPGSANETFFQAGTTAGGAGVVQFGPNVTITARWLIFTRPVTPGSYSATTDELIFFIDLTGSATDLSSSNGDFTITMPASGWWKMYQT